MVSADIDATDTREALREIAHRMFEFATSDPARAQLLFQRTIPGFEPSPESYAPAVEMFARVQALLESHGITDPDAMDLWTALISGLVNQQLANDPGGDPLGPARRPHGRHVPRVRGTRRVRNEEREEMMETKIDEIADGVFRLSTFVPDANIMFNQFVVRAEEPLLFHTGLRASVPARVRTPSRGSCRSISCGGSRSGTSRPTSAAR